MSEAAVAEAPPEVTQETPPAPESQDAESLNAQATPSSPDASAGGDTPEATNAASPASETPSGEVTTPVQVERTAEEIAAAYRTDPNSVTAAELNRAIQEGQRRLAVQRTLNDLPGKLDAIERDFENSDLTDPNVQQARSARRAQVMAEASGNLEPFYDARLTGGAIQAGIDMLPEAQAHLSGATSVRDAMARAVGWLLDAHEKETASLRAQIESLNTSVAAKNAEIVSLNPEDATAIGGTGSSGGQTFGTTAENDRAFNEGRINRETWKANDDRLTAKRS